MFRLNDVFDIDPVEKWPVVLDVHPECDAEFKSTRDQMAKILFGMMVRHRSSNDTASIRRYFSIKQEWVGGWEHTPLLSGGENILDLVFYWARGCHALLYDEALPWPIDQVTYAPAPDFDRLAEDPHTAMAENRERTLSILRFLADANDRDCIDTVVLMRGLICYSCVWLYDPRKSDSPWLCAWSLDCPGTFHWSAQTRGFYVPWHGCYATHTKPTLASVAQIDE
ncbi:MAG: hypothetical protein RBS39_07885 [Phycisphaerales bacterium]|nr:hypothetical protein [Phycisphaerales bacterium]